MDAEIPLDADGPKAGVCVGCRQVHPAVWQAKELRAGPGPWCRACLGELMRRAIVTHPAEYGQYRSEDDAHAKVRRPPPKGK